MFDADIQETARIYRDTLLKRVFNRNLSEDRSLSEESSHSLSIYTINANELEQNTSYAHTRSAFTNQPKSYSERLPAFAIDAPQRHQTCVPLVGTIHDSCAYSRIFMRASRDVLYRTTVNTLFHFSMKRNETNDLSRTDNRFTNYFCNKSLRTSLLTIAFAQYTPSENRLYRTVYDGVMAAHRRFVTSSRFDQLSEFLSRFRTLIRTMHHDFSIREITTTETLKRRKIQMDASKVPGTIELFQKMLLMHVTYFISEIILEEGSMERIETFLASVFNIQSFTASISRHFRQRATVFLVPRRHGKTWILVQLIALLVSSFEGIRIGYTAHLRKATEPVFEEIHARLCKWFGYKSVEHIKGETIIFTFPGGGKSCVIFTSSQNTNVSIQISNH
ncbi:DNA packaging terminase subunit 1 [Psittacid alphaherpesvirus 5]|uniref:DNA packaging terminase subunit 1 n=1 Tax=Psittacid alphaherpesvirus 5 TaxID=2972693 RepID=A0A5P9JRY5_9ALPH|nr:DNA packaging terminase subunit 1 [Psittacid alphaherpesvirus 5]QFU14588.1 DNA packaging terminase subunit 1 [Psittacid alphaherpesvirus 5]UOO01059.1 DNA packaging terminase subunit 1 [Psittacid alphaherpesvirus 5]